MKSQILTEQIPVTTYEEKKTVIIEMTYDEAALLFCLMGQMDASEQVESVDTSISCYNPKFKYLLGTLEGRLRNLIHGLYGSLNKCLTPYA